MNRSPAPSSSAVPTDARSVSRRILHGLVVVSAFVLLAKLAGAGKEMALAARYGVGPVVDAYGLVYGLVMWPVAVAMSVLTTVLIPLEARMAAAGADAIRRFRGEMLALAIILAIVLAAALWLLGPPLLESAAQPAALTPALSMLPGLAFAAGLALVATLYSVWVMSGGGHANSALEGVPALVLLATVLLAPLATGAVLVWGTAGGSALHLLLLVLMLPGVAPRPVWQSRSSAWRLLSAGLTVSVLGQLLISATGVIELFIAARLGEGAVATLGYANRLLGLFTGLVVLAITRAMLPLLSAASADGSIDIAGIVITWLRRMLLAGTTLAVCVWFAAEPMTRLVFERGLFGPAETLQVAEALRWASLQLAAYLPGIVLTNCAAARGRFGVIAASAVVGFAVRPIAGWVLGDAMGVPGLTLAQGVAYAMSLAFLVGWFVVDVRRRP